MIDIVHQGVCNVSISPVRMDKVDVSEMVTQILYGESVDILEISDSWNRIKMHYDGCEGWVDSKQITPVESSFLEKRKVDLIETEFTSYNSNNGKIILSIGSEVENNNVKSQNLDKNIRESISRVAEKFYNVPYLWGGRSFFGIDCSGFTQIVMKLNDIKIPRKANKQGEMGFPLGFIDEAQKGDLAFFENSEGEVFHVGIILEDNKIIHAHGKVRIDMLDSSGIFNQEQNRHTHKLRFIRNIVDKPV